MESVIRNLRIQTLKSQLDVCQFVCATVANELKAAELTLEKKASLARRWGKALVESRSLQHEIDRLERQEMGSRVAAF
jgi:hypothetical protein